ncbi:hypothetical protein [Sphingomonas sp.]|uniref:hypothetical protein n=1 Tax=Sphingomonas sp. TaxID=28214 RepID=UPI001AFD88D6|nr:hypothetical protein [Sphingomonas sp.]MBO9712632.1 hypothetical protein [Sphingomonas sp.]
MTCPHCGSFHADSNLIQVVSFEQLANTVTLARRADHPAFAFGTLALWGGVKFINLWRKERRCVGCGHRY